MINSIGNLGGFVAPTAFGFLEQTTGSIEGGLYGLAATSLVAAVVIFFARTAPKRDTPNSRSGRPETVVEADQSHTSQALKPGPSGAAV
ncbi:putative tartrate transporter [compost metagenome]